MECTRSSIIENALQDPSWFCANMANSLCAEHQTYINFFKIYWCDLEGNKTALVFLSIISFIALFKYTSITVEEYIAEGIQNISDWLKVSESLSASALMTIAYSSSTIMICLLASASERTVDYSIGLTFGSCIFFLVFVAGCTTIHFDTYIDVSRSFVFRYLIFTSGGLGVMVYLGVMGHITWWAV